MKVTVLGYGGAEIGFQNKDTALVSKLLNTAFDAGLNMIDTAECYHESETLIGDAVSHRRGDFYLFSKCGHAWEGSGLESWNIRLLELSIDRSLKRLKTDVIDLMQLHSCGEDLLRTGEVIEVLQRAKAAGKVRYIGYSGDNANATYAIECGAFDTLQTSISLFDQSALETNIPLALSKNMGVIVKRPIGNAVWLHADKPDNSYILPYWERMQSLPYDFLKRDATEIAEMALRFTLSVPGVHTAIVGTSNPERWAKNADIVRKGSLSPEAFESIRAQWKSVATPEWVGQV